MLFASLRFAVFFLTVFAAYWLLPWRRVRVYLLLAASVYFYASWSHWLALVICASTTLDYVLARSMEAARERCVRKVFLTTSIVANLGLLCYFKYANFFLDSLEAFLNAAGAGAAFPTLKIVVPIGISFYTFEAISYTVDVYYRRIHAERNLTNLLLFILFFPHLIAGPIVRGRHFLPQVRRRKPWNWARLNLGVQYFALGLFKKLAIADRMALFADPVFADPAMFTTHALWMAALAYALQVYCDFSGYSDMAVGTAHMLGYKLPQNFNLPYLSRNISEFWRRWNMTLSSWLRDYLFIPLGGSRVAAWKVSRNLLVTMTLGGLWHGANWTYVLFGALQGLMLVVHRSFRDGREPQLRSAAATAVSVAFTFCSFVFSLVLFRATSVGLALTMWTRMLWPHDGRGAPLHNRSLVFMVAVMAVAHAAGRSGWWQNWSMRLPAPAMGLAYGLVVTLALFWSTEPGKVFIYFQF